MYPRVIEFYDDLSATIEELREDSLYSYSFSRNVSDDELVQLGLFVPTEHWSDYDCTGKWFIGNVKRINESKIEILWMQDI